MRSNSKCVNLNYFDPVVPKSSAKVFDFDVRKTEGHRHSRVRVLEQENALLASVLLETRIDILRLRKLLMEP
jgi:hypothetical protein